MSTVLIVKEKEFNYDICVYQNGKPVKRAWAMSKDNAMGKAEILADYFTDENGQRSAIVYNDISFDETTFTGQPKQNA